MQPPANAPCNKCGGRLCTYERSEVIIEQCEDCRGIFLDQGELERLIEAEGGGWSGIVRAPSMLGPRRSSTRRDLAAVAPARIRGEPISARPRGPDGSGAHAIDRDRR
jgi:Zn-finger nucleic acid-binding protein